MLNGSSESLKIRLDSGIDLFCCCVALINNPFKESINYHFILLVKWEINTHCTLISAYLGGHSKSKSCSNESSLTAVMHTRKFKSQSFI